MASSSSSLIAGPSQYDDDVTSAAGTPSRPRTTWQSALLIGSVVAVVALHFRPWQGALLEDWGLAVAWNDEGFGGYFTRLSGTLGRPFHLLPQFVGMAVSGGSITGPYALLAVVAVAQFAVAMWALRSLTPAWIGRWALALALALHPWWVAGDILRFMPAQVSVLAVVVWLGAAVRYLQDGRSSRLLVVATAPTVGLLTYQGPAAAFVAGAVILAVVIAPNVRRALRLGLVTGGAVFAVLLWSIVLAPRMSPNSYESQLMAGGIGDPLTMLRSALRTLILHGRVLLVFLCIVGIVVIALGLAQKLAGWQVWSLLAILAASPVAALVYGSNALHLNDPERLVLPVGVVGWLVAAGLGGLISERTLLAVGLLAIVSFGSVVGAVGGYVRWTGFAAAQQDLLEAVEAVREDVPDDATVIVEDTTGRYGDVYLLLPPHLNYALDVEYGAGADGVLCTASGVQRNHPVAALFPIVTTPDCAEFLSAGATYLGEAMTDFGLVKFHLVR